MTQPYTDTQILAWLEDGIVDAKFFRCSKTDVLGYARYSFHPGRKSFRHWVVQQMKEEPQDGEGKEDPSDSPPGEGD